MSDIPGDLHYSEEHEYIKPGDDAGSVVIGITDYAQGELGDVVYIELPDVGTTFDRMDVFGTIEAVKAVSELFMPVAGEILEVNGALQADPALINRDPYDEAWMIKVQLRSPGQVNELLTATDYATHIGE
jgi:glycine cleavage system H protein